MTLRQRIVPDSHVSLANQSWSNIEMYYLGRHTVQFLNYDQVTNIQNMYAKLYPDLDKSLCVVPNSFKKSKSVTLGYEIFGSIHSRIILNRVILAKWNKGEGKLSKQTVTILRLCAELLTLCCIIT